MESLLKLMLVQRGKFVLGLMFFYRLCFCADSSIIVDTFSANDIPKTIKISGRIVDGIKWKDKNGVHSIVISEDKKNEICEPGYKSQIYAFQYSLKDTSYSIDWKIQDFGTNECEKVYYLKQSLRVVDIEKNGVGESRFLYEFGHDCCDPLVVKYMLHVNESKLPIRGKIPMQEDDKKLYEKNIDKTFDTMSKTYKDFASKDWDDFVENHYEILNKKN